MHQPTSRPVAVAVAHDGVESALRFAAREALVRGSPLRVVAPASLACRSAVVAEVLAGPGVPVDVVPTPGDDLGTALETCGDADLVVVHHSSVLHLIHALSHGRLGATTAQAVLACVPPDWSPRLDETRPVVLAVDHAFDVGDQLRAGLELACLHEAPLHVVHAWDLHRPLRPEEDQVLAHLWGCELEHRLREQLAALAGAAPWSIEVRRGSAADLALDAAAGAQLLVLGRNQTSADQHCRLGRTTRSALHVSPCPVLLLPSCPA